MRFSLCAPTVRRLRSAVSCAKEAGRRPTVRLLANSPHFSLLPASTRRGTLFSQDTQCPFFSKQQAEKTVQFRKKEEEFPRKVGSFIVQLAAFSKSITKFNHKSIKQNQKTITRVHAHSANFYLLPSLLHTPKYQFVFQDFRCEEEGRFCLHIGFTAKQEASNHFTLVSHEKENLTASRCSEVNPNPIYLHTQRIVIQQLVTLK